MRNVIYFLVTWVVLSCHQTNSKNNTDSTNLQKQSNFILTGDFYNGEIIELKFNDSLVFNKTVVADSIKIVNKYFLLNYNKSFKIALRTLYNQQKYLDTIFIVNEIKSDSNFKLTITHPHPSDWKKYYKDGIPSKNWGYLPIDSSIRFVHLSRY